MTKKLLTLISTILLVGCSLVAQPFSLTSEGFTATGSYQSSNTWSYTVTGELPNPCHTLTIVPAVDSSGNEVTLLVTVIAPEPEVICVQSTQSVEEKGTFTANPTAKVTLSVQNSDN
jgi:hypothetical protein